MTQPRTADGRYAEKPGVGLARRMSERLREALGHDGLITPPEKTPLPSIEELLVRVDALNATVLVEPDLTDVDTLTGAAMVLGTDTITDTAEAVLAMGKAAPLPLIYDARQALETKDENWDAKLHPRDGNGRFINVGAVLNLLGSVGGGRGTVIGNGPNNTVTIRREDGTTLDVPGDQTYADGEGAPTFGQAGVPDTFSKTPGSFAKTPAAAAKPSATGDVPDAKTPPADRISPPNLPNDRNELFRALNTNQATRGRPDKMALHFAANAIGATGNGRESGTALASHSNDQATNDRIGEMLGPLSKIADELDADGVTVTTDGGAKLSDYLRDYADGFHQIHQARIDVTAEVNAEPDQVGGLLDALAGGGFTWREDSGYRSDGFAVAVPGHGQSFPPGEVDRAKLIDYARSKASELRANPALHLGGWVEDDGTSWLDLSEVYDTKDEAYQAGQGRGEIAIADIAAFAKGEDGTVPISYAERPPSGPAADKWDDPNSGVLKDGGKENGVPDTAAGGGDGRGVREPGSGRDAGTGDPGAAGPGAAPADVVEALRGINTAGRPDGTGTEDDPIDVGSDINRAVELLAEGKHIRLSQPDEVATLLDRLAELTKEAKAKGDKAPVWDLCRVSVPGTNLFCAEHQGIKRIDMPQLEGSPIAGTPAADMEANQFGNVNLMESFVDALDQMGVSTTDKTMPASHLRASQRELDGSKVAGIMKDMKAGDKPWLEAPIFVTRDGYVIDGHHRWAAKVGLDVEDGKLGDVPMDVRQIDLDVGAALDYANAFTARMGIASQGVDTRPGEAGATNAGEVRSQEDLAIHESIVRIGIVQQRYLDAGKDTESLYDKIHGKKDKYTAEREAQHESVIAHFVDAPTVKKDEKAVIIGGLPGAGKTTFINSADGQARLGINLDEYVTVNPDDVKEEMAAQGLVPNYEGLSPNEQATLYHEEASAIAATIMERAMEQGKNVLYDTTMKGEHQTDRMVNAAKASGHDYSTTAVFIDVPIDTAKERALSRYQNGGRFVPLGIIDRLAAPPDSGYNSVNAIAFDRSKSKVDQWVHVDNSSFADGPKIVGDSRDAAKDAAQTAMDKYGVDLATANEIVSLREQMRRPGTDDILWQALEDRLVNLLPRKAA